MSVTAVAIPWALIFSLSAKAVVASIIGTAAAGTANALTDNVVAGLKSGNSKLHLEHKDIVQNFYNKNFDTVIMDENALIKTLKEHGATDIKVNEGQIECNCQYFHLTFVRSDKSLPYTMKITASESKGVDEFASDIGNEYTLNAQEISYNKIKERLEAQNLEISNEEVFDDNTIVLTVNLED